MHSPLPICWYSSSWCFFSFLHLLVLFIIFSLELIFLIVFYHWLLLVFFVTSSHLHLLALFITFFLWIWCSHSLSSLPIFICSSLFLHLPTRCYPSFSSSLMWIVICLFHPLFPWIVIHHLHYFLFVNCFYFFHGLFSWIIIHFPCHFSSFTFHCPFHHLFP